MDSFELPNIDFRSLKNNSHPEDPTFSQFTRTGRTAFNHFLAHHGELLGVAAMLLLFILPFSTFQNHSVVHEGIRVKGNDKVILYRERQGQVSQIASFEQSLRLENGDRVRVEVLAAAPRKAFYFISSTAQSRVLTAVEDIFSEQLTLAPGDRAIFPGSIELVGENEGETLNVILCEKAQDLAQLSEIISKYSPNGMVTPKGCLLKAIRLR
jgi:hypothetical protein